MQDNASRGSRKSNDVTAIIVIVSCDEILEKHVFQLGPQFIRQWPDATQDSSHRADRVS